MMLFFDIFFQIVGLSTNISFLDSLASHPEFEKGNVNTGFIDTHYNQLFPEKTLSHGALCQAALALVLNEQKNVQDSAANSQGQNIDRWLCHLCL